MNGIYIHIPFCKQACRYCDYFFSVSLRFMDEFVKGLIKEIQMRGASFSGPPLDTLYLGGGTPSLLSSRHLDQILEAVFGIFSFREDAEITMECNPDDLNQSFLLNLSKRGFNRLSIGVQSFHEKDLVLMRRSHNASQAEQSINSASAAGFNNISMDLIYGIPGQTYAEWESNVEKAMSLPVSHLSAYHLTFEPGTVFDHWKNKGRLLPVLEDESIKLYNLLKDKLFSEGYEHYEISNFAKDGNLSRHNLLYWSGLPYMGIGPSAHSYDGTRRSWNISSLKEYIEGILLGKSVSEFENLSKEERYHDYLITSLRTKWGTDPAMIEEQFGEEIFSHFIGRAKSYLEKGILFKNGNKIAIHPDKWLITDHILRDLFVERP